MGLLNRSGAFQEPPRPFSTHGLGGRPAGSAAYPSMYRDVSMFPAPSKFRDLCREMKPKNPKAPKSAYLCYEQEKRTELLERWVHGPALTADGQLVMPEVRSSRRDHGDISREVGRAWKVLSVEEKQMWEAESQKDQARYHAECAEAGVQPKLFPHIAGQVRIVRPDRLVDNEGGAGLVDPKLMGIVGANMGLALNSSRPACNRPSSAAAGGAFALARLTAKAYGAAAAQTDQPSERTITRTAGKKWNAATRSFV